MPYCPRCGVELDPSVRECPLCATAVPVFDDLGPGEPAWPSTSDRHHSTDPAKTYVAPGEWKSRVFIAIFAVFLTATLTVLSVDLFVSHALTWSRYPMIALAGALAYIVPVFFWRRGWIWVATWFFASLVLIAALDAAAGTWGWAPAIGLPIVALSFALITAAALLIRRSKRRGYNQFALLFALVAVELGGIDGLVTSASTGAWNWGWSVVSAFVLLPFSVLFLVLHFGIRRTPDLHRIFHF